MNKKRLLSLLTSLTIVGGITLFSKNVYAQDNKHWIYENNNWTYVDDYNNKSIGWEMINNHWYYFNNNGNMLTGWQYINNHWYLFSNNGDMQTGWKKINGYWYHLKDSGDMSTNWDYINNNWYYFNNSGVMQTGWKKINNNWYYFNNDGNMVTNSTIDGWSIGNDGIAHEIIHSTAISNEIPTIKQSVEINSSQFQQAFRIKMLNKINSYRASKKIEAFKEDKLMNQLSNIKVKDMCEYEYFDHTNPYTETPVNPKWNSEVNNVNVILEYCSENIYKSTGWNSTKKYKEKDLELIVNSVFNAWKNSPPHNATMLSSSSLNFGISIRATDKYIVASMDINR